MGNQKEYNYMIGISMAMDFILLLLYICAHIRVKTGSDIKDVKLITSLLIASTAAGLIGISMGFIIEHMPQEYAGFTYDYVQNDVNATLVSKSPN